MRAWLSAILCYALLAQQPQQPPAPGGMPVFQASSNLVIVTVFARDSQGKPVRNLTKDDFVLLENGKPQSIRVFDFQDLDKDSAPAPAGTVAVADAPTPAAAKAQAPALPEGSERFRDRRLLVLFFDWNSLPAADQIRAKESAEKFLREQMTPSDMVAIASFGSRLKVDQEFTTDRDALFDVIRRYQSGVMSELATEGETDPDTADTAGYTADDTEFNVFNTDRKLSALEDLARRLAAIPEKKALVYFSSGVSRSGTDNEAQLRSTINSAVRSNVSFYPIDVRGLTATPPGGAASSASPRGTGLFTGQAHTRQRDQFFQQQDTLSALAADTGGKALFDNNDLTVGIRQAQRDFQSYYILGYYSSDERRDGQFRRVDVKLSPSAKSRVEAKLDFRRGYFAIKEFKAFNSLDKERQLEDALQLGDPVTDLPIALEVGWFRFGRDRYFVPVAVKIPGSAVPLAKKGSSETTQFDFIGQVKDSKGVTLSNVRDSIKIQLREANAGQLASRSLIYDTGFTLAPGPYRIKMLVRENQTGKMGTFESAFTIPDLSGVKDSLRMSSVLWSSQQVPITEAIGLADKKVLKKQDQHPLVRGKEKLLPSVTRVFRNGQTLLAYAELYDPVQPESTGKPRVVAAVGLYSNKRLVVESAPVSVDALREKRGATAGVLVELPLKNLPAGRYTAQFNLIDEAARKFAFSRATIFVLADKQPAPSVAN